MSSDLNVVWIHGANNCSTTTDPPIQVHRFNRDTFILRQSKCSEPGTPANPGPSFEAPFMYLLFGATRALLLDTGASSSSARFPLASTVGKLRHDHTAALGTRIATTITSQATPSSMAPPTRASFPRGSTA